MIDKRSKSNRDIFYNRIKLDARALHINIYTEFFFFPYVLIRESIFEYISKAKLNIENLIKIENNFRYDNEVSAISYSSEISDHYI